MVVEHPQKAGDDLMLAWPEHLKCSVLAARQQPAPMAAPNPTW